MVLVDVEVMLVCCVDMVMTCINDNVVFFSVRRVCVCEVYVQTNDADVKKAVQAHLLLLKTLSRSGSVQLVDTAPSDVSISLPVGRDTTLHVDVDVSGFLVTLLVIVNRVLADSHANCGRCFTVANVTKLTPNTCLSV